MQSHYIEIKEDNNNNNTNINTLKIALNSLLSENDRIELQNLLDQDAKKVITEQLRPGLAKLLATESPPNRPYPASAYKRVYSILLFLTRHWPLNQYEQHSLIDPILLAPIDPNNRVCLSTGYQFDKNSLATSLQRNNNNPLTNTAFNNRDLRRAKSFAAHTYAPTRARTIKETNQ